MGIVLKRRDNAPIVKTVYKGIMDRIMNDRNIEIAKQFLKDSLNKLLKGGYPIDQLL